MNQKPCNLYPFLKAVRGNWHNSIFLNCSHNPCPYGQSELCEGYLLASNADGCPLLMPVKRFREATGESISLEECCSVLEIQAFESAYSLYIEWHTLSPYDCPLKQLCQLSDVSCKATAKDAIPP